jgi:lipopolysaccharide export system protein LptA
VKRPVGTLLARPVLSRPVRPVFMALAAAAVAGVAAFALTAFPAGAQIATDSDAPIEVTAEQSAEYFRTEGKIVYTKNVRATQGETQINSDTLTVICSRDPASSNPDACADISQIIAQGNVIYATPRERIKGDKAEYDYANEIIVITGNVILSRGDEGVAKGTRLVYDVRQGRATITSGTGPVIAIFNQTRSERQSGRESGRQPQNN